MASMFKNMDNSLIKSMMQMQGINMSDEQLNMMKNNMNPQMMKMAANAPSNSIPNFRNNTKSKSNSNLNRDSNSTPENKNTNTNSIPEEQNVNTNTNNNYNNTNNSSSAGFPYPDMGNMDLGKMMEFTQKNPQFLKMMGPQMSQMFGGGENGNPKMDPNLMMNAMQNILWLLNLPSRIKQFFLSTRGKLFILVIIVLIGSYLYR